MNQAALPSIAMSLDRILLWVALTVFLAKAISYFLFEPGSSWGSGAHHPPKVATVPWLGGLLKFMRGPMAMVAQEHERLGSVFTVDVLHRRITFLLGPRESATFFKAPECEMSQQEVYQFNVPTFGPGVVFDVDYSVRMEQFRFFTESLRVASLKGYVAHMVLEAEVLIAMLSLSVFLLCLVSCVWVLWYTRKERKGRKEGR
jgi:sterol 14-demethylase